MIISRKWHNYIKPIYAGIQLRLPCTPAPEDNFHGCQIVHWDPLNAKRSCSKKIWYGLCENACMVIANLRMGVCLLNNSYLSCYLTKTTKLNIKLNLDIGLLSPCCICQLSYLHMYIYEYIKNVVHEWRYTY